MRLRTNDFAVLKKLGLAAGLAVACATAPFLAQSANAAITYEEILAAPDDLDLNLRYARQEVASGRLQQAAAALERLLLNRPNWDSARLFYGIVLYRMGDYAGTKRELVLLEGRDLSADQEADRVKYLALAERAGQKWRFRASVSLGSRFDSNPGRTPKDVAPNPAILDEDDDDAALTAASRFQAVRDMGNAHGDFLFLEARGYLREFFDLDRADFGNVRTRAGFQVHRGKLVVRPYVEYGSAYVDGDKFRTQYGGGVDVKYAIAPNLTFLLSGRFVDQEYETTTSSQVGSDRDGWLNSGAAGFRWRYDDTLTLTARGTFSDKDARNDGYSYDATGVRLNAFKLLGDGRYLSLSANYVHRDYDQPDDFYSPTITREDESVYLRAVTGAPLSTIFRSFDVELPESIGDITAQIGVSYQHRDSNIDVLDFENVGGELIFTKRFKF